MNEQYRGLNLYGGCEPISGTLLGWVIPRYSRLAARPLFTLALDQYPSQTVVALQAMFIVAALSQLS
jgi:hypothetical protein